MKGDKGEKGQADDIRAEVNRLDVKVLHIQANISGELDDEINRVQRNGELRIHEANQEITRLNSKLVFGHLPVSINIQSSLKKKLSGHFFKLK